MLTAFCAMWSSCAFFVLIINGRAMAKEVVKEVRSHEYDDRTSSVVHGVIYSAALVVVALMFAPVVAAAILARGRGARMDE